MRGAVFGVLYILLGKRMWFFPNILAEEATLRELFRFWPNKDEEEKPKWTTRLFYAMVAVLIILLMRHHAPDEAARARLVHAFLNSHTTKDMSEKSRNLWIMFEISLDLILLYGDRSLRLDIIILDWSLFL